MTAFAAGKVGESNAQRKQWEEAEKNFDLAEQLLKESSFIDPEYARPYIGLANLDYMRAIQPFNESGNREDIDIQRLEECYAYLDQAQKATNKPPLADAETKIHFARGQCLMMDVYSGHTTNLASARAEFQRVINDFGEGKNPRIQELAAEAHGRLALIYRWVGENDKAVQEYDIAANLLSRYPDRQKVFLKRKADIVILIATP
jgi:tetratricopeptide (TPR) repeat protein